MTNNGPMGNNCFGPCGGVGWVDSFRNLLLLSFSLRNQFVAAIYVRKSNHDFFCATSLLKAGTRDNVYPF